MNLKISIFIKISPKFTFFFFFLQKENLELESIERGIHEKKAHAGIIVYHQGYYQYMLTHERWFKKKKAQYIQISNICLNFYYLIASQTNNVTKKIFSFFFH